MMMIIVQFVGFLVAVSALHPTRVGEVIPFRYIDALDLVLLS